jgi:hypothetical protein
VALQAHLNYLLNGWVAHVTYHSLGVLGQVPAVYLAWLEGLYIFVVVFKLKNLSKNHSGDKVPKA